MKTNVSVSSLCAYRSEIVGTKKNTQMAAILDYLTGKGWVSRKQIARDMEMEPGTVAGRVNELVKHGQVIVNPFLLPCPVSGRNVHFVRVAEQQADLFGGAA